MTSYFPSVFRPRIEDKVSCMVLLRSRLSKKLSWVCCLTFILTHPSFSHSSAVQLLPQHSTYISLKGHYWYSFCYLKIVTDSLSNLRLFPVFTSPILRILNISSYPLIVTLFPLVCNPVHYPSKCIPNVSMFHTTSTATNWGQTIMNSYPIIQFLLWPFSLYQTQKSGRSYKSLKLDLSTATP